MKRSVNSLSVGRSERARRRADLAARRSAKLERVADAYERRRALLQQADSSRPVLWGALLDALEAGVSQADIARRLGLSRSRVSRLVSDAEMGENENVFAGAVDAADANAEKNDDERGGLMTWQNAANQMFEDAQQERYGRQAAQTRALTAQVERLAGATADRIYGAEEDQLFLVAVDGFEIWSEDEERALVTSAGAWRDENGGTWTRTDGHLDGESWCGWHHRDNTGEFVDFHQD